MPQQRTRSGGAAAIGLATFMFVNLILFFAMSGPFATIGDMLTEQADSSHLNVTSGNVSAFMENFQIVFGLMFILSAVGLVVWYTLGSHRLEGEEY